ncbi:MAG: pyridoxamine 5'-phosphate oxidase family protein [Micrococcales bacterium]|nr:pyridoxamine 5'-phosphate oxidase family protein [Micrococcales bacterium]
MGSRRITTLAELKEHYPAEPAHNSLAKESEIVTPLYRELIEASPFCVVVTVGEDGLDCSPRGDAAGFVRVCDSHTLEMPDRRGNNRLDTLRNLIAEPMVGLIFLIPGVGETIRVRGHAHIDTDPELLASHAVGGKTPASVIVVEVTRIYFQCARAVIRSGLWDTSRHADRSSLPTAGMLTEEQGGFTEEERADYDAALEGRQRQTLY